VFATFANSKREVIKAERVPFALIGKWHAGLDGIPVAEEIWLSDAPFDHANDREAVENVKKVCPGAKGT